MFRILKYSIYDLLRSRWMYIYLGFYMLLTFTLFWLSSNISGVILSLMNIILVLVPLVALLFGVTYYYNSREFTELLLAQPLKRIQIFLGQYFGLSLSLNLCLLLGLGIPFVIYGLAWSDELNNYLTLMGVGIMLTFVFTGLSMWIAVRNDNRIVGFGLAVFLWLLFAVIYDGIFLLLLSVYSDYPLETFALTASMFNPIDLSRILVTLQLDIAALMGYTGAVFQKILGSGMGRVSAWLILVLWVIVPLWFMTRSAMRKDF